jgi:peptide/nickel transport system substrate-binding protein
MACSSPEPAREATTVRISQGSDILSFDPYFELESPSFCIQRNVFDPLTDYDANVQLTACLATEWTCASPTEWVLTLRAGVLFQNGEPFGADDVVFSIRRALDWPRSRVKPEIQTIDRVEAIDDAHVRIATHGPDVILPLRLTSILMLDRATSERAIAEHGDDWLATHPNGTGPYRLEQWIKDERCTLVANENYWGERPEVRRMEFLPTANDASRIVGFDLGSFDIMTNVPPRAVDKVEQKAGYRVIRRPGLRLIYLGLDVGRDKTPGIAASPPSPLRDVRVRRAIALAIHPELIDRTIMNGNALPAYQLFPDGVTGHDPTIEPIPYDPDEAKRLLAEAGYPRGFTVRLDGPNDRYLNDAQIMTTVAQNLGRIGIAVEVNAQPKARFFTQEANGECSFFLIGWANTNGDGIPTFDHLLHTADAARGLGAANTSTNYSNPEVDALCERASREFDPPRRAALLQQANRLAMADLPHVPIHFQMDIYAVSERLEWHPRRDTQVRGADIRVNER